MLMWKAWPQLALTWIFFAALLPSFHFDRTVLVEGQTLETIDGQHVSSFFFSRVCINTSPSETYLNRHHSLWLCYYLASWIWFSPSLLWRERDGRHFTPLFLIGSSTASKLCPCLWFLPAGYCQCLWHVCVSLDSDVQLVEISGNLSKCEDWISLAKFLLSHSLNVGKPMKWKKNKNWGRYNLVASPQIGAAMAVNDHTGQQSTVTLSHFVKWPFYVEQQMTRASWLLTASCPWNWLLCALIGPWWFRPLWHSNVTQHRDLRMKLPPRSRRDKLKGLKFKI